VGERGVRSLLCHLSAAVELSYVSHHGGEVPSGHDAAISWQEVQMTFFYVTFGIMFLILLIGTIIEDRRYTPMEQTVKAILARFDGNAEMAHRYCVNISDTATNAHLRAEYQNLAIAIYSKHIMQRRAAHV
jgi:hypothetical protein